MYGFECGMHSSPVFLEWPTLINLNDTNNSYQNTDLSKLVFKNHFDIHILKSAMQ